MFDFALYNTIDYVLLIIVAASACFGILRGATHEIFSISAWIISVPITMATAPYLQKHLLTLLNNQTIVQYASWIIVYIVSLSILTLVSTTLSRLVKRSFLAGIDAVFGCVFGIARGVIIIFVLYLSLAMIFAQQQLPSSIQRAHLSPYVWHSLDYSVKLLHNTDIFAIIQEHTGYKAPVQMILTRLQECKQDDDIVTTETSTANVTHPTHHADGAEQHSAEAASQDENSDQPETKQTSPAQDDTNTSE